MMLFWDLIINILKVYEMVINEKKGMVVLFSVFRYVNKNCFWCYYEFVFDMFLIRNCRLKIIICSSEII